MEDNALDKYSEVEYVVGGYADNEDLQMSVIEQDGEEDYLYLTVRINSVLSINMIDPKPQSWRDFVNNLIPVSELEDRAEVVLDDLIDAYEKAEVQRMEGELEIELEHNYRTWFENAYKEEPGDDFRISVEIFVPYSNFTAEDLIMERKLIRDNR